MSFTLNSGSIVYSIDNKDIFKSGVFTQGINSSVFQDLFSSPPSVLPTSGEIFFVNQNKNMVVVSNKPGETITFSNINLQDGSVINTTTSDVVSTNGQIFNSKYLNKIYFRVTNTTRPTYVYLTYDVATNAISIESTSPAYFIPVLTAAYEYGSGVYYIEADVLKRKDLISFNTVGFTSIPSKGIMAVGLKDTIITSRTSGSNVVVSVRSLSSPDTILANKTITASYADETYVTRKILSDPILFSDTAFMFHQPASSNSSFVMRIDGLGTSIINLSTVGNIAPPLEGFIGVTRGNYLFRRTSAVDLPVNSGKIKSYKFTKSTLAAVGLTMQNTTAGNFNIHPDLNLKPFKVKIVVPGIGPVPNRGVVIKDPNSGETIGEGETDENGKTEIDIQYPTVPDGSGGQTPVPPIVVVPPKPGDDPDNPPIPVVVPDPSDPDPIYGYYLHGCVVDKNDVPVSRVVLVISRETDKIVATGLSDAANNGEFTIPMMNNKQVIVMVKGTGGEVAKLYDYVVPLETE